MGIRLPIAFFSPSRRVGFNNNDELWRNRRPLTNRLLSNRPQSCLFRRKKGGKNDDGGCERIDGYRRAATPLWILPFEKMMWRGMSSRGDDAPKVHQRLFRQSFPLIGWCPLSFASGVAMATRVRKQWFCRISLNCFQKFSVWHVGSGSRSTENVITRTSSPYGNREEKKNKFCFTTISCKTKSRILCLLLFGRRADALSEFLNCFQFHSGVVLYVRARRRAARANWFTILNWKRIEPGIMHTPTLGRRRWDTPASYDSSSSSSLNWIRL